MWILPPITGQAVILNPEHSNYSRYMEQSGGTVGHIRTRYNHDLYKRWVNHSQERRNDIHMEVQWENGHINSYRLENLLPISNSFKEHCYVEFRGGHELYGAMDYVEKQLDKKIIKEGRSVYEKKHYGEAYRKTMLKHTLDSVNQKIRGGASDENVMLLLEELTAMGVVGSTTQEITAQDILDMLGNSNPI